MAERKTRTGRAASWKRGGRAPAESARLDALLDAAAAEFNARGVSGASLAAIAQRAGVRRAALYYYFDTREDLARQCYLRACQATADDLAAAAQERSGLRRVLAYVERALDPKRAPAVVLGEVAYLGEPHRAQIGKAHGANLRRLQGFVADGIADGSVRDCDARVAAQAIFGMLSWVPIAGEWVEGSGTHVRAHAATAIGDLIENGVAADPATPFHCQIDAAQFGFRPGNAFDRKAAAAQKIELILVTASAMFNRRGIDGTSLDDITAALGATKGAFYQYLPEKRALVVRCVERAFDLYERFAEAAETGGRTGLERTFIGLHLNAQAQAGALSPLLPVAGLEGLPPRVLARIRARAAQLEARFERFGRAGIADGSLRRYDLRTLASAGAGAFGWIPKWRDDAAALSARTIADEIVALFAQGLRRRR